MQSPPVDTVAGYRRRFIITPEPDRAQSAVEDDYHCMAVTVHHDGQIATKIEAAMPRAPWTTCPGAVEKLKQTFTGIALNEFAAHWDKRANCTHLYDLAVLAAAHARDDGPLVYDILVSDPIDGRRRAELRRNHSTVLGWVDVNGAIVEPAELSGISLENPRPWLKSLDPMRQEAARLLLWGATIARGRTLPWERQSDASQLPAGSCYTFQPDRINEAKRIGAIRDFSRGTAQPLEKLGAPFASQAEGGT